MNDAQLHFIIRKPEKMRIPPVVKALLLLNIAAYILDVVMQGMGISLSNICGLYYFGSNNFHIYQLITYMFMHGNLSHIFFNMFALWMFGRIMEQTWGGQKFLLYYLVCGVGAGLIQELGQVLGLIYPGAMTIGASGAVYGILLSFGMIYPNEKLFIIPIPVPIKAKWFVICYALIELMQGLSSSDGVAHFAHLGGMLFGLLLILYWRKQASGYRINGKNFWNGTTSYDQTGDNYDKGEGGIFDKLKDMMSDKKDGKSNMHVHRSGHQADYDYNARKKSESAEIDRILDKIRKGGYQSLTDEEKSTLFNASKK